MATFLDVQPLGQPNSADYSFPPTWPVGQQPTWSGTVPWGDETDSTWVEYATFYDTSTGLQRFFSAMVPGVDAVPIPAGERIDQVKVHLRGENTSGDTLQFSVYLFDSVNARFTSFDPLWQTPWGPYMSPGIANYDSPWLPPYRAVIWDDPAAYGEDPAGYTPENHPGTLLAAALRDGSWRAYVSPQYDEALPSLGGTTTSLNRVTRLSFDFVTVPMYPPAPVPQGRARVFVNRDGATLEDRWVFL